MKILYGITKSNFGGAQRYVLDLARQARKAGHEVSVISGLPGQGGEGVLIDKLKNHGIKTISLPTLGRDISPVNDIRSFMLLLEAIHEEKPDVFHINSSKMGGIGALAARFMGVKKIIFTAHGWAWNEPRPMWQKIPIKALAWLTILLCHKTICVSEKTCKDISNWPFIKNKLVLVKNGVEKFDLLERSQARREFGTHENDTLIVGTIAELHPIKGIDVLLEAWDKFSKNRHAQLVIIGDGEIRESLEHSANNLGLSHSVTFKGYVEEARKYLSGFDIFCLPSRSEALPYTILEAGMAELPVIASAVGGIPEIIKTSTNGALVPPEDSETLFSTLVLLAEDRNLRNRLGKNLKETILKDFSIKKMFDQTLKTYL